MGPLADSQGPGAPQRLFALNAQVSGSNLLRKMFKNYFQKILMFRNTFVFFIIKIENVLEKF